MQTKIRYLEDQSPMFVCPVMQMLDILVNTINNYFFNWKKYLGPWLMRMEVVKCHAPYFLELQGKTPPLEEVKDIGFIEETLSLVLKKGGELNMNLVVAF